MQISTKTITIIALFAAVSIVLSLSPLKFSAPYATFLKYQVWEIAIVTAFLLYGMKVGISIATINTLILFVFFPGDSPIGPLYNFIAVLSTLFGIFIIQFFISKRFISKNNYILIISSTISAIFSRVLIMSVVNWITLPYPPPIGYQVPLEILPGTLTLIAFFNATLVLYTIPLAYFISRAVSVNINTTI